MANLWTKNGRPLQCEGNEVFVPSGALVGRLVGDRVFRADGDYVGTFVGDRLVYRTFDIEGPNRAYTRRVSSPDVETVPPVHTWGDEPKLPE